MTWPFLVAGTLTVADARPAADAVTVETLAESSAKPTMTVSEGWKPPALSSMLSPVPRVSPVKVAMFFEMNSLTAAAAGAELAELPASVVDGVDDELDDGAVGVPLTAFDATESPTALTALIVTEYAVPLVRPVMVNGLVVDAGERAVYVVPSVEYL